MSAKSIIGHCLCKQVSYVVDAEHQGAGICHCESCRRGSGAPFSLVIVVPRKALTISGPFAEYLTNGDSGKPAHRVFCPNCGSQIANNPDAMPDVSFIKAGTLDYEIQKTLSPAIELYTAQRLPCIPQSAGTQFVGPMQ